MKKIYYFIILLLIVIIGLLVYLDYRATSEDYDAMTREGCEKLNGKWGTIGLGVDEECNLRTSDFGDICYDRSDCQGECIAELNLEEAKSVIEEPLTKNGKCSEYRIVAGCQYFVNNGKVNGLICVD